MRINDYLNNTSVSFEPGKVYRLDFSVGSEPIEIKHVTEKVNFSEDIYLSQFSNFLENFSLLELIRVNSLPPKQVLRKRINEVARYVNSTSNQKIIENRYTINNYLNNYIYEQIMKMMSDPKDATMNLIAYLGLNLYMKDLGPLRNLQRYLVRSKSSLKSTGVLDQTTQKELKKYYGEVWTQFVTGIEEKYFGPNKLGVLSGATDVDKSDEVNVRLAAFSENPDLLNMSKPKSIEEFVNTIEQILELKDSFDYIKSMTNYLGTNKQFIDSNKDELVKYLDKKPLLEDYKLTEYFLAHLSDINNISEYFAKVDDEVLELVASNFSLGVTNFTVAGSSAMFPNTFEPEGNISGYLKPVNNNWYYFKGWKDGDKFYLRAYRFDTNKFSFRFMGLDKAEIDQILESDEYLHTTFDSEDESAVVEKIKSIVEELTPNNYMQFSEDLVTKVKDGKDLIIYTKLIHGILVVFFGIKLSTDFWELSIFKTTDQSYIDGKNKDFTPILSGIPDYQLKLHNKVELEDYINKYIIIN